MGVPNSQLTTIVSAKYQLTTIFLARSEFSVNCLFWLAINFHSVLQQILFCHNPNFLYFSTSNTFGGRSYLNQGINLHEFT